MVSPLPAGLKNLPGNSPSVTGAGNALAPSALPAFGITGSSGQSPLSSSGSTGLQGLGVSSSTLQLMSQISMMMATVMTGLMAFMQQLLASQQQKQTQTIGASTPGATGSPTSPGTPGVSAPSTGSPAPSSKAPSAKGQPGPASSQGFISPLKKGSYTLGDGLGAGRNHTGQDMPAAGGTPIMAAKGGTVTVKSTPGGYGQYVEVQHPDGTMTRYAHMSKFGEYKDGQQVNTGDVIGYVGTTGNSTGNHLHFEIFKNGQKLEPKNYAPL